MQTCIHPSAMRLVEGIAVTSVAFVRPRSHSVRADVYFLERELAGGLLWANPPGHRPNPREGPRGRTGTASSPFLCCLQQRRGVLINVHSP